ncbi:MAG: hypothetical protein II474_10995, partial [Firmicutes bacterium]|nr:hypothetical protein [Bacillota bacterium]
YCEQLFAERRRIERTEPDSEERRRKLMDLTSQIYVADYMAKNAEQRIPLGFPHFDRPPGVESNAACRQEAVDPEEAGDHERRSL